MTKQMTINSSSLSSVIGKNPFNNRSSIYLKLFRQNNIVEPKGFERTFEQPDFLSCKNLGIKNEKDILKAWSSLNDKNIVKVKSMKKKLFELNNTWYLSGIADGLVEDNSLIEIKYRTKKFNDTIPIYDYIQIQSYMHLYDYKSCYYVQSFNNEIKSETFQKNDVYWYTEIIPKVIEFAQVYESLCDNSQEFEKFLYFNL